jgi:hypothetical protein
MQFIHKHYLYIFFVFFIRKKDEKLQKFSYINIVYKNVYKNIISDFIYKYVPHNYKFTVQNMDTVVKCQVSNIQHRMTY